MDLLGRALPVPDDKIVLVSNMAAWTRHQLAKAVEQRADALGDEIRNGGVHPATLNPDARGVIEMLAAWSLGAVVAPLSPQLTPSERSGVILALSGAARSGGIPPKSAVILWTSGTSGESRGVGLSEHNFLANTTFVRERLSLSADDVWYASLSVAHVGGLMLVVRALLLGSTLIAPGKFDVDNLVKALAGQPGVPPVTHVSLVPTQLVRLLDAWGGGPPPETLKCVLVGGAGTPEDLLRRALDAGWPIALTYGMTEMASQVATATPEQVRAKPGSVGKPLKGVDVAFSEEGEILLRGVSLAAGLFGTKEALTDEDGWYHTEDMGSLDEDGDLWISGRQSDRIISGGVNVDPLEVEAVLRAHPAVRDACVVGLPDTEWGERVAAVVVPAGSGLDQSRLEDYAYENLGAARLPRRWRVLTQLPTNRNGKVDRNAVREILLAAVD